MIKGQDLLIACSGRVIACSKACTLDIGVDTIEVCSPTDGAYKRYIPTIIGWSVSTNGLIATAEDADALIDMVTAREEVRLSYYDTEMKMVRSGYAIPTKVQQGAQVGSIPTYTVQLQGTGELAKVESKVATVDGDPYELQHSIAVDESHCIVQTGECEVYEYVFSTPTRLTLEVNGSLNVAVLVGADIDNAADWIEDKNSVRMFKHELAHVSNVVSALGKKDSVVVTPGHYCVIVNKGDGQKYKLTAVSLPVA